MPNIAARLKEARLENEWSQDTLAKKSGVSQGTIGNIESGARLSHGSLPRIAEALGVRHNWLRDGDLPKRNHTAKEPNGIYNVTPSAPRGKVPVISWVQAGTWCEVADPHPVGGADEWLDCPAKHSKTTYALKVRGSSMFNPTGSRSFSEGDIIFVDPERDAQHRSLVICRVNGEATFKMLLVEGDDRWIEAINPAWPDRIVKLTGDAHVCGVVIGKFESY